MAEQIQELFDGTHFIFGTEFLRDHAGHLISEPRVAIVELIANAYDAGAQKVDITWPEEVGGHFEIADNGTGMTEEEFQERWRTLCYNRMKKQGLEVQFPPGVKNKTRVAFGSSGKGRHSAFCFANSYHVETWKDGQFTLAFVEMTQGGIEPFRCTVEKRGEKKGHGTKVWAGVARQTIPVDTVRDWVGSKFLVDPSFAIIINRQALHLTDLKGLDTKELDVPTHGKIVIHQIDASGQDRSTRLRGITWWVNTRMVGQPSWDGLDQKGAVLDGRTAAAKRYSFIIEADILKPDVKKDDWSGFYESKRSIEVRQAARDYVISALDGLLASTRKERKKAALAENTKALGELSRLSRRTVGQFVEELQEKCPTLSQGDLARTVEVFTKMEQARSGYDLLQRLAVCSSDDIDTWNRLMQEWTANNAEIVLRELGRRLSLIKELQGLVNTTTTDELHDLQPLFARGLWIFGPEYEAVEFTSNRGMVTVIRKLLGGTEDKVSSDRPDLVALPDRSIGVYTADSYDNNGEVSGVRKVLIVELKKGGFEIKTGELRQGEDYALELQKAKLVRPTTEIFVYVLGATFGDDAQERSVGKAVKIIPMIYDTVLKRAQARTFNLQQKLDAAQLKVAPDPEVEEVLAQAVPQELL